MDKNKILNQLEKLESEYTSVKKLAEDRQRRIEEQNTKIASLESEVRNQKTASAKGGSEIGAGLADRYIASGQLAPGARDVFVQKIASDPIGEIFRIIETQKTAGARPAQGIGEADGGAAELPQLDAISQWAMGMR